MHAEPIHVSARFCCTVEATILELERNAAHDELQLPKLLSPDHRRRQRLLVQKQLDRAFRLREMLSLLSIRRPRAA
jgi:hypothetical protein